MMYLLLLFFSFFWWNLLICIGHLCNVFSSFKNVVKIKNAKERKNVTIMKKT